jgi:hypothetical protein
MGAEKPNHLPSASYKTRKVSDIAQSKTTGLRAWVGGSGADVLRWKKTNDPTQEQRVTCPSAIFLF